MVITRSKSQKHKNINLINLFAIQNNNSQKNTIGRTRISERTKKFKSVSDNNGIVSEILQKKNNSATNFNSNASKKKKNIKSRSENSIRAINMESQSVDITHITENHQDKEGSDEIVGAPCDAPLIIRIHTCPDDSGIFS